MRGGIVSFGGAAELPGARDGVRRGAGADALGPAGRLPPGRGRDRAGFHAVLNICKFFQIFYKILQFLAGSFSAVSKRNFAGKYAFDSIFQALQDLHTFAPLQSQNFRKKSV